MDKSNKPAKLHFEHYVPEKCNPGLPPIIFVHGICDSIETWETIFQRIADETKRQAYAIDLRNHGKSEWNDSLSHEAVVQDIEYFMDKNGIEKTIFVTHSFGSRACMSICLRKPERVEKIVVEDTRLDNMTSREIEMFTNLVRLVRMVNYLPKTMSEKELRTFMSQRAKDIYPNSPEVELATYYIAGYQDTDGTFRLSFNIEAMDNSVKDKSLMTIDYTGFQTYNGPTLIICGDNSVMEVEKDKMLPRYFPNAEFYRVKNASHYVHRQYKDEFRKKVCDFINS